MDCGFLTPLLDMLRRGELPRDIKMMAARGALVPRPHEQLGLLVALADDPDLEIRVSAVETMDAIPRAALEGFLARSDTTPDLQEFFAKRGVQAGEVQADEAGALIDRDGDEQRADAGDAGDRLSTLQRLSAMTVAERMKAGMKGTREQRAILIRDPNKLVAASVLSSPKLSDSEVESFAKMANVSEEVLRIIGNTRAWVKNYSVTAALTRNAKTPLAVSLTLVKRLNARDVKMLSMDRNIPEALRMAVRKQLVGGERE